MIGKVVCATGRVINLDGTINEPRINEAIPEVTLSTKKNDPTAFGVISSSEDNDRDSNRREYKQGAFVSCFEKKDGLDRVYINSLGEGAIWVCTENGPVSNGDWLTTSSRGGYAMRQTSKNFLNSTCTQVWISCTYHCG